MNKLVCEHGSLRRSCLICEAISEYKWLKAELGETNEALAACRAEGLGWKSKAEKLAEALRHVDEMIEPIDEEDECNGCTGKDSVHAFVHDEDCDFKFIKEALANWEKVV